ncbi:hypothetical protein GCM10029992_30300 [Glycomyces albus]
MSWDDSALCRLTHPALTALSRDIHGHGSTAAEILLRIVAAGATAQDPMALSVQCPQSHLTPRASTGSAPDSVPA